MKFNTKSIKKNVVIVGIILFSGKALSLLTTILFARIGGASVYGEFALFLAWINIIAFVVTLGLDKVALKFVPAYHENKYWSLLRGVLLSSHLLMAFALATIWIVIRILIFTNVLLIPDVYIDMSLIGLLLIFLKANNSLLQSTLRSFGYVILALTPRLVIRQMFIILLTVLLIYFSDIRDIEVFHLGLIVLMGSLITTIILLSLNKIFVWIKLEEKSKYEFSEWKRIAIPFFFLAGINLIMNQTDLIMVGWFLSPQNVAVYSVVLDLSSIVLFVLTAVSAIVVPLMSRHYSKNDGLGLIKIIGWSSKCLLVVSTLIVTLLALVGRQLLELYGDEFPEGYNTMLILLAAFYVNSVIGPLGSMLNMTGAQYTVATFVGLAALLNIVLNFSLIPMLGIQGAAIATMSSTLFWNVSLLIYWIRIHSKKIRKLS